jgi:twitching motility protein PilT
MALVDSLLAAMVRADGDALVMHVGERPYVVTNDGTLDLSTHGLNLDAMTGMLQQLLPPAAQASLEEFGAVEHKLASYNEDRFAVVAARGGDDIWIEIRRRRSVPVEAVAVAVAAAAGPGTTLNVRAATATAAAVLEPIHSDRSTVIEEAPIELIAAAAASTSLHVHEDSAAMQDGETHGGPAAMPPGAAPDQHIVSEPATGLTAVAEGVSGGSELVSETPEGVSELSGGMTDASERVIEVAESAPASTPDMAAGSFELEAAPAGNVDAPVEIEEAAGEIPAPLSTEVAAAEETAATVMMHEAPATGEPDKAAVVAPVEIVTPVSTEIRDGAAFEPEADAIRAVDTPASPMTAPPLPENAPAASSEIERTESAAGMNPTGPEESAPVRPSPSPPVRPALATPGNPGTLPEPPVAPPPVPPMTRTVRIDVTPRISQPRAMGIERLLHIASARGASALYLTSDSRPYIRLEGDLRPLDGEPAITRSEIEAAVREIVPESEQPSADGTTEWIAEIGELGRIHCTSFTDHRGPGVVFRMIATRAATAEQLGLAREIQSLATEPQGLVLVTGARGSGKSTLMSALVDLVNRQRAEYVITLEPQVRLVHDNRAALVSQREIRGGPDQALAALGAALRENPDVLVVDDLASGPMVPMLVDAAAGGLLVFVSISAPSTTAAVQRFIEMAPAETRSGVQATMADTFRGAVAQMLLKKTAGGRVTVREVLLATAPVTRVIADGLLNQLPLAFESGRRHGMTPFADALVGFVQSGVVDIREVFRKTPDRDRLLAGLKREGIDTSIVERLA